MKAEEMLAAIREAKCEGIEIRHETWIEGVTLTVKSTDHIKLFLYIYPYPTEAGTAKEALCKFPMDGWEIMPKKVEKFKDIFYKLYNNCFTHDIDDFNDWFEENKKEIEEIIG